MLLELHIDDIVEKGFELQRAALTKLLVRDLLLDFTNLFLPGRSLLCRYELPWQAALEQPDDDIAERDQIVTPWEL